MIWFAPVALAAAAVPPPGTLPIRCTGPGPVVFVNAAILTMDGPTILPNGTVVVRNGRIAAVNPRSVPADACRIDLAGGVLLPGLADMHVHTAEAELPVFLANGVTLVREMNGTPGHLRLRDRIARGEVIGPRMLVASPLMVGAPLQYRHRLIASAAEAALAAREVKAAGYDYLKIYDGLSRESYDAFVETAAALGLPLEGHIPAAVGLARVLETGQSLQHMEKIGVAVGGHQGDTTKLGRAARLFAGRRTWVTPTLAVLRVLDGVRTTEYAARLEAPEMAWADSASLGWWRSLAGTNPPRSPSAFYRFQMAALPVLRAAGARFLLGTDAANPLMVAGFSVHDELAAPGPRRRLHAVRGAVVRDAERRRVHRGYPPGPPGRRCPGRTRGSRVESVERFGGAPAAGWRHGQRALVRPSPIGFDVDGLAVTVAWGATRAPDDGLESRWAGTCGIAPPLPTDATQTLRPG